MCTSKNVRCVLTWGISKHMRSALDKAYAGRQSSKQNARARAQVCAFSYYITMTIRLNTVLWLQLQSTWFGDTFRTSTTLSETNFEIWRR